jgi:hypothetical protein
MSLFLIDHNNLGDVQDIAQARSNLGIDFLYDPNEVNITSGAISVNKLCLRPHDDEIILDGSFLVSHCNGCGRWESVDLPTPEQLSNLSLMNEFLSNNGLDLGRITNVSSLFNDANYTTKAYTDETFLHTGSNLSDLLNPAEAIENLGLGHVATSNIHVQDIRITNGDLYFDNSNFTVPVNNVLSLDSVQKKVVINRIADNQVEILDSGTTISNSHSRPPSVYLLKQVYQHVNTRLSNLQSDVNNIVIGANVLQSMNNLADVEDPEKSRSNLGLVGFGPSSTGGIFIDNLTANTFMYENANAEIGKVLTCTTASGLSSWMYLPQASNDNFGTVKITDDHDTAYAMIGDKIVPSLYAMKQISSNLTTDILNVRSNYLQISNLFSEFSGLSQTDRNILVHNLGIQRAHISDFPSHISHFTNDSGYLKRDNFLAEIAVNLDETRNNLGLTQVAWTGDFYDLSNLPSFLRDNLGNLDFSLFAVKSSNLSDIDPVLARQNLQLGDIVMMNTSDVYFTGGSLSNMTSVFTREFIFPFEPSGPAPMFETLSNIIFLKADNPYGHATWGTLPFATIQQPGIAKLISNMDNYLDHSSDSTYSSTILNQKIQGLENDLTDLIESMSGEFSVSNLRASNIECDNLNASGSVSSSDLTVTDSLYGNQLHASNLTADALSVGTLDVTDTLRTSNIEISGAFSTTGAVHFGGEVTFETDPITRTSLVDTITLLTDSMIVDTTLKYLQGMSNNEVHLYKDSIMHTDEHGNLRWGKRTRIIDDKNTKQAGLFMIPSEHTTTGLRTELNMQMYCSNGMIFVTKETGVNSDEYQIRHIFR